VTTAGKLLVIACGALAKEIHWLKTTNAWDGLDIQCLDAELHNRPEKIPEQLEKVIQQRRKEYQRVYVAYGDCGTGGGIDRVVERWGVERLPGTHCYEIFATPTQFHAMAEEAPGTFYLTDFLVRHFERLVMEGLKINAYPQLRNDYFGHYTRVVYLAQTEDPTLLAAAEAAAASLSLPLEVRHTGLGDLSRHLEEQVIRTLPENEVTHAAH
jgi:hypothetical protein